MKKWEYCFYYIPPGQSETEVSCLQKLNEKGSLGWELVSVVNEGNSWIYYYFKRPLIDTQPEEGD